jgi:hypothetical protein
MNKHDIESKLSELKGKQSEIMKVKKGERDAESLKAIREEMSDLKSKLAEAPAK